MATRKKTTDAGKTKSRSLREKSGSPKKKATGGKARPTARKSNEVREKLIHVTPGGSKDTTFFELVFEVARQIPRGRVTSYGAIAACLGAKSSSRMVGWAMNGADKVQPKLPAHRVVNRNGMLSGKHHFATPTRMQELLEKEGIKVKNDTIVDFKKVFWDPAEELI